MIERGLVLKRNSAGVKIQMQPSGECDGCNACLIDEKQLQIINIKQQVAVKPGDEVEIEVKPGFTIRSAFLIFCLPLIMFLAGYYLFQNFTFLFDLNSTFRGILGGFIAFIVTYIGVHYYDRYLQNSDKRTHIKIVKVVKQ